MKRFLPAFLVVAVLSAASSHAVFGQSPREARARHEAELRGRNPAPAPGDPAPKVSAKSKADGTLVDLSKVKRATVLVFGSHT